MPWDFQKPDFNDAVRMESLKNDFLVLKLKDKLGAACILKGEVNHPSAAIELMTQEFVSRVLPEAASLQVANVTTHWDTIDQRIQKCMKHPEASKAITALTGAVWPGAVWKSGVQRGHLSMMSVGSGEPTSALALANRQVEGKQEIITLLYNPAYLKDLGALAALDVYTCQTDRILAGNLGNWMSDAGRVSAVIDNTNKQGTVRLIFGDQIDDIFSSVGDRFVSSQNIKPATLSTSAANAECWALACAIDSIFTVGLVSGGIFQGIMEARKWHQENNAGPEPSKTNYQYFYDKMKPGWDEAVKKLKTRVTAPQWKGDMQKRIEKGSEQVPPKLIQRLEERNKNFLGV